MFGVCFSLSFGGCLGASLQLAFNPGEVDASNIPLISVLRGFIAHCDPW